MRTTQLRSDQWASVLGAVNLILNVEMAKRGERVEDEGPPLEVQKHLSAIDRGEWKIEAKQCRRSACPSN
jgi:hypothetical protein